METHIRGRPENTSKKETRALLEWLARELHIHRYKIPIYIDLRFIKDLGRNTGGIGWCIWEDDNHRPREFNIEIDKDLGPRRVIKTIIHEMVHVAQYSKGRMKDLLWGFSAKKWCGKIVDVEKIRYIDLPWEIEARALEAPLYKKWKNAQASHNTKTPGRNKRSRQPRRSISKRAR